MSQQFDFITYHYKAMNAQTEEEKIAINQELKTMYASLSEEDKKVFNEQLQQFLISEYAKISSLTQGIDPNK